MLVKIEQYEGGKTTKRGIQEIIYKADNLYQKSIGFFMARQTGVYQIVKNLCEFSMGLEEGGKYLSFFPVIKKKNYKKATKMQ